MKAPQWLTDFYDKWWKGVKPPEEPWTHPYEGLRMPDPGGTLVVNHVELAAFQDRLAKAAPGEYVEMPPGYDEWLSKQPPKDNWPSYLDRTAQAARLNYLAGVASDPYPSAKKKPCKRQPIKARKALKKAKARKRKP